MREYFKNSLGPDSRCALGGAGAGSAKKNKGTGVAYLHHVGGNRRILVPDLHLQPGNEQAWLEGGANYTL